MRSKQKNLVQDTIARFGACAILTAVAVSADAHPDGEHAEGSNDAEAPAVLLAQAGPPRPQGPPPGPRRRPSQAPAPASASDAENEVSIAVEGGYRVIESNGWPAHTPEFPRRGNPNAASPQSYTFRVTTKPKAADQPVDGSGSWWGVALNGVPFEPGTAENWNNDRQSGWRYEAATGFLNLGLDDHNAHVQPTGAYHYHALPTGLVEQLGGDGKKMIQVGWAADGFPVYTGYGYADANDATSALRKVKSSYRLKKGPRPETPGGPGEEYDGRFTQDFEYVKGSGDLDECNGRTGVTPEFPEGIYHYYITDAFPFVPRMWRGTPDESFRKGGPGHGRGGGGGPGRGRGPGFGPGQGPPPGGSRPPGGPGQRPGPRRGPPGGR